MTTIVYIIHTIVSLMLIIIVLLQAGKGAEMGAAFGGASKTVFGPRGAAGPLAKITVGAAVIFMLTSIYLTRASKPGRMSEIINIPSPTTSVPVSIPQAPTYSEQPTQGVEIPMSPPIQPSQEMPASFPGSSQAPVPAGDEIPAPADQSPP